MVAPFCMENTQKIKYFAYCRKSSDDSERQVMSLDVQRKELDKIRLAGKIHILKFFEEAKTAKEPGREKFNQMLDEIERGKADGILCWKLDRLARNPVDAGRIQWLLQKGIIKEIRTYERIYRPEDHTLITSVEMGMANQYSRDLRTMAFRTIRSKIESGWRPGLAPIGYINKQGVSHREIAKDPIRFDLIRKIWDLFLTGNYPVSKIRRIANGKWAFRTRETRKMGGKPLTMSHIYKILNEPFYYGWYEWKNPETGIRQLYPGKQDKMITKKEYDRAQILLGRKGKPQAKTREFAFTGLMTCGECSSAITAEEKNQIICSECKNKFAYENKKECPECNTSIDKMRKPVILNYTYYHCTKKKNPNCSQKSIRIENLEAQFDKQLQTLKIEEDYLKLALEYLQEKQELEMQDEKSVRTSLERAYDNCQSRINNLNKEYTSPQNINYVLYAPEEFSELKNNLIQEKFVIEKELKDLKQNLDKTLELSERTFNFCAYAHYHFANGDNQRKKEIFSTIGSNLILKDKLLAISKLEPYMLIEKELSTIRSRYARLEPEKSGFNKREEAAFAASSPSWLPGLDSDQDKRLQRPLSYH